MSDILELYQFNRWAHERSLDAAGELNSEQYNCELPGSYRSIRATLEHVLSTEVIWLARWEGHSMAEGPDYTECLMLSRSVPDGGPIGAGSPVFLEHSLRKISLSLLVFGRGRESKLFSH